MRRCAPKCAAWASAIVLSCPVVGITLKGEGQLADGDHVVWWIHESETEVIGSFNAVPDDLHLNIPPASFAESWAAAAAADGAIRDVTIYCESDGSDRFRITGVELKEWMPRPIYSTPKHGLPIPARQHPVVAELRRYGVALWPFVKWASIFVVGLLWLGIILRGLSRLIQP